MRVKKIEWAIKIFPSQWKLLKEISEEKVDCPWDRENFRDNFPEEIEDGKFIDRFANDSHRSLYGIIGIKQAGRNRAGEYNNWDEFWYPYNWSMRDVYYSGFFVPDSNYRPIQEANKNGHWFRKKMGEDEAGVLSYIAEKTRHLKSHTNKGHRPRFSAQEIANHFGCSRAEAVEKLHALEGILCHVLGPDYYFTPKDIPLQDRWFLPSVRDPLVLSLMPFGQLHLFDLSYRTKKYQVVFRYR